MAESGKARSADKQHTLAYRDAATLLAELGRQFYHRGWLLGTSGNLSAVVSRRPFRLAITHTGVDKGCLTARDVVQVDDQGNTVRGSGRPSDETRLHLALVRCRGAGAVLHTHSIWGTIASEAHSDEGGVSIAGYEMLKGLDGVRTHEHGEWLPIIENSQDMSALAQAVEATLAECPNAHGFLLRRHGLYSWGKDLSNAKRHVEILEFLLEVMGRKQKQGAGRLEES